MIIYWYLNYEERYDDINEHHNQEHRLHGSWVWVPFQLFFITPPSLLPPPPPPAPIPFVRSSKSCNLYFKIQIISFKEWQDFAMICTGNSNFYVYNYVPSCCSTVAMMVAVAASCSPCWATKIESSLTSTWLSSLCKITEESCFTNYRHLIMNWRYMYTTYTGKIQLALQLQVTCANPIPLVNNS